MTAENRFRAMGTDIVVIGRGADMVGVRSLFEATEAAASRFRPDSDLERLNDDPAATLRMPDSIRPIIEVAAVMRERTGGLVDIGLGSVLVAWGYDRTFTEVTATEEPGMYQAPQWWLEGPMLRREAGTRLDLGGVAKGWTVDQVIEQGLADVVSAGGDLRSTSADTLVEILDPSQRVAAGVGLGVGALATSSVSRRRWKAGTTQAHHLIDPRTLRPALTPIVTASAVAGTAVEAEAAAKAILLQGEEGLAWADRQDWIRGALAIWDDGSVYATTGLRLEAA